MKTSNFDNQKVRMALAGVLGLSFFVLANFGALGSGAIFGVIQIAINSIVFVVYLNGYKKTTGFTKFVAVVGVIVPIVMASITLWRVLLPEIIKLF